MDGATAILRECHRRVRDATGWSAADALDGIVSIVAGLEALAPHRRAESSAEQVWRAAQAQAGGLDRRLPAELTANLIPPLSSWLGERGSGDRLGDALMVFLSPTERRASGAFHTPRAVVAAMVGCAGLTDADRIVDPACGSGAFLVAASAEAPGAALCGWDRDARALRLAGLNLAGHPGPTELILGDGAVADRPGTATVVLMNPPFGLSHQGRPSELAFIRVGLRLLQAGGRLWAVVPRSVLTNKSLRAFREEIDALGALRTVVSLPPETFAAAGAGVSTAVIELVRRPVDVEVAALITVNNVGHDATGRSRDGEELSSVPSRRAAILAGRAGIDGDTARPGGLATLFGGRSPSRGVPLGQLCQVIATGRTPPRKAYAAEGAFVVKVGNLTGAVPSWQPRQRNFVPVAWGQRGRKPMARVQPGDILLTATAHNPAYIARKVDYVVALPDGLVWLSGEVMGLRPDPDRIEPLVLYLWLRSEEGGAALRSLVRGQTAHLYAADVAGLRVEPERLVERFGPLVDEVRASLQSLYEARARWQRVSADVAARG